MHALLSQWYAGQKVRVCLVSKLWAIVDGCETITRAAEKARVNAASAEAKRARQAAAPAYLRERVERGEALPLVEVEEEDGPIAGRVLGVVVMGGLKEDAFRLLLEMMVMGRRRTVVT